MRNIEYPIAMIGFPYRLGGGSDTEVWPRSLTLHQLEIFAAIDREGSFTKAAETLSLSEPSVSQQLKLLEGVLGARLFDRAPGKPTRVTQAGVRLRASCADLFELLERTAQDLELLTRAGEGRVVFGATRHFCDCLLPGPYATFHAQAPGITVRVEAATREPLLDGLRRGHFDLVVVDGPVDDPQLVSLGLAGKDLILIGPPHYALPVDAVSGFEAFASDPMVRGGLIASASIALTQKMVEWGLASPVAWEADRVEARINSVSSGLGIAAVPFYRAASGIASGTLAPIHVRGFPMRFEWAIVARQGDLPEPVETLRQHLLNRRAELEMMCACPIAGETTTEELAGIRP